MNVKILSALMMFFILLLSSSAHAITYTSTNLSCYHNGSSPSPCEYSYDGNYETALVGITNNSYLYLNFSINGTVTNLTFSILQATNGWNLTYQCLSGNVWITWLNKTEYPFYRGYYSDQFYPLLNCIDYTHNIIQYRIIADYSDELSEGGAIYEVTSLYDISSVFSPYNCTVTDVNPALNCENVMDRDNETGRVIQASDSPPDNAWQATYNFSVPQYVWSANAMIYFESNDPIQELQINWSCRKADGTYYAFNNQMNISINTSTVNVPLDCFIGYSNTSINLSILNLGTGDTIKFTEINLAAIIGDSTPPLPPTPPTMADIAYSNTTAQIPVFMALAVLLMTVIALIGAVKTELTTDKIISVFAIIILGVTFTVVAFALLV